MPSAVESLDPVKDKMKPEDLKDLLKEIGVTEESLKRDAVTLREWVNAEPHLPNLTDEHDEWLETFILASKNSMEKAKMRLDNYFSNRTSLGDWFVMPPPPEDQLLLKETDFMLNGFVPRLLPGGYVLLVEKVVLPPDGSWSKFDLTLHYRRSILYLEAFLGLSKKVRGAIFLLDEKHINLNVITTFIGAIGGFRKTMNCVQDALPLRIQSIHLANAIAPNLQRMMLGAVTPLLKGKLAQRIIIHNDHQSLHQYIPPEYLPAEYSGTSTDTIESLSNTMSNFIFGSRDWYSSRKWMKTDEDRRLVKKPNATEFGVEGSFRKLTVD